MSVNFHVSLTAVLWWCMPEDTLSWNSHVQLMRGISSECWTPSAHCGIMLWCQRYHVAMPTLSYCDASAIILRCRHYHVAMPTLSYFLCHQHYHIVMPALSCCVADMMMLWCYIKGSKERCLYVMPTLSCCHANTIILWCQRYHIVMSALSRCHANTIVFFVSPALSYFDASIIMLCCRHDDVVMLHKRFKGTLFIRTKHIQSFRVIPLIKLQNNA